MNSIDFEREFPNLQSDILEIARELQSLILHIFPKAVVTNDGENVGFGFGSGYRDLVFTISPFKNHVNLGIANGATLDDPVGLMQGSGKVHRHIKFTQAEQLHDPHLEELMLRALSLAERRTQKGA